MIVSFCGHSSGYNEKETSQLLAEVIEKLIQEGADTFYLGGYGQFDSLAARAVREAKKDHSGIKSILVIPYLDREYNTDLYDETLFPPIENALPKFAISARNKWMVEASDVVVSGVKHDWGDAWKTEKIARQKKKRLVNLYQA